MRESEVAQSCLTLSNPTDCSLPGSSGHGIYQERVLEWGAIAFSKLEDWISTMPLDPVCNSFWVSGNQGMLTLFSRKLCICRHLHCALFPLTLVWAQSLACSKSVQSLSWVWLFATPWTAARQASLSITNSQSLVKLMPSSRWSHSTISSSVVPVPAFNLSQHQGLF